jgi:hypothetical protein
MPCNSEVKAAGMSYGGAVANLAVTFWKSNTKAVGVLGVAGAVAAMVRLLVDLQNIEDCARLHKMDVDRLQGEHARLEQELAELQRQQQAAQQKAAQP